MFVSSIKRTTGTGSTPASTTYNRLDPRIARSRWPHRHPGVQIKASGSSVAPTAVGRPRQHGHHLHERDDKGVPIYWLNGNKVVDDYEDFYDGDPGITKADDKDETGHQWPHDTLTNEINYPVTGCDDDGTEDSTAGVSNALGASSVAVGRPNSSGFGNNPISSPISRGNTNTRPLYGLSCRIPSGHTHLRQ